jgi:hypothetical protein
MDINDVVKRNSNMYGLVAIAQADGTYRLLGFGGNNLKDWQEHFEDGAQQVLCDGSFNNAAYIPSPLSKNIEF